MIQVQVYGVTREHELTRASDEFVGRLKLGLMALNLPTSEFHTPSAGSVNMEAGQVALINYSTPDMSKTIKAVILQSAVIGVVRQLLTEEEEDVIKLVLWISPRRCIESGEVDQLIVDWLLEQDIQTVETGSWEESLEYMSSVCEAAKLPATSEAKKAPVKQLIDEDDIKNRWANQLAVMVGVSYAMAKAIAEEYPRMGVLISRLEVMDDKAAMIQDLKNIVVSENPHRVLGLQAATR